MAVVGGLFSGIINIAYPDNLNPDPLDQYRNLLWNGHYGEELKIMAKANCENPYDSQQRCKDLEVLAKHFYNLNNGIPSTLSKRYTKHDSPSVAKEFVKDNAIAKIRREGSPGGPPNHIDPPY